MFVVYAIYNRSVCKVYIGQTEDIVRRIAWHNDHTFKSYTARFPGKWELIYQESAASRPEALRRERQLKSGNGRQFIKSFIPE